MLDPSSRSLPPPPPFPIGGKPSAAGVIDVFDPSLAEHPTRILAREALVDVLHVTNLPEVVERYRTAMQQGDRFPPVSVVRLFGIWFIADGHKRFTAYRSLGAEHIVVEVWPMRRWLRDHVEQGRATWRRWRAALHRDAGAPSLRALVRSESAHLRRMLVSVLTPRHGTKRGRTSESVAARLLRTSLRHRTAAGQTILGFLLLSATQLGLTWLIKLWIDGPLSRVPAAGADMLIGLTVFLVCLLSLSVYAAHAGLGAVQAATIRDLRGDLQAHLLRLELAAARRRPSGDLVARLLHDADVAGRFGGEVLRRGLGDALVLVGALAMLLIIDHRLFGLIALLTPLGVLGHTLIASRVRARSLAAQRSLGMLATRFGEQIAALPTIKGARSEAVERDRFGTDNQTQTQAQLRVERWSSVSLASIWLVSGLGLLGLALYAGHALANGRLAAGDFLVFCLFGAQLVEPIRRLGEVSTLAQRSLAAGQRLYEVLDQPEVESTTGRRLSLPVRGEIRFTDVRFEYVATQPVLNAVTFNLGARETVAIVSPSGGGKSTLAALLVRFYKPAAGTIELDGHDIAGLHVADLRRAVQLVAQEPFLFAGSIEDNIRYGSADVLPRRLEEAVHCTGLEVWLQRLSRGLRTPLEEAGRNLSVGQKQRLALARAVVADPPVVILDEATSAVDSDTEEQIMERLDRWLRGRTVILMAHRLSTVLRVPRALVLESGRIVEDAAPLDLVRRPTAFARIFRDQLLTSPVAADFTS